MAESLAREDVLAIIDKVRARDHDEFCRSRFVAQVRTCDCTKPAVDRALAEVEARVRAIPTYGLILR